MKSTTIKQISQRIKSKYTWSIYPHEQGLKERKLQIMNLSLTSFKITRIPLLPDAPHEAVTEQIKQDHDCLCKLNPQFSNFISLQYNLWASKTTTITH